MNTATDAAWVPRVRLSLIPQPTEPVYPDRRTRAFRKRKLDWTDHAAVHAYRKAKSPTERKPKRTKAEIAAYLKAYRHANKDRLNAKSLEGYRRDPEKVNLQNRRYRAKHPERTLAWSRKSRYGLTPDQAAAFGDRCHICDVQFTPGSAKLNACVDHDHRTGEVRGLLCVRCNAGVGHFRDDAALLARAIEYLAGKSKRGVV